MTNYAALSASDGSGEPVLATVQAPGRDVGSVSIPVNATTNWPTGTFIATTGTLQSDGTLDSPTVQVFYGTASGTTITITAFASGYSDVGNSTGDVVVVKPTTEWANVIQGIINDITGNGTPQPITASTLRCSGNPVWQYLGYSKIISNATTSSTTFTATGITSTVTTPTGVTAAKITIDIGAIAIGTGSGAYWSIALYKDGAPVMQWYSNQTTAAYNTPFTGIYLDVAPTAASHTYAVLYACGGGSELITLLANAGTSTSPGTAGPASILVECC